jgi:hypothetical protein
LGHGRDRSYHPTGISEVTQVLVDGGGNTIVYGQNRRIRTLHLAAGMRQND